MWQVVKKEPEEIKSSDLFAAISLDTYDIIDELTLVVFKFL